MTRAPIPPNHKGIGFPGDKMKGAMDKHRWILETIKRSQSVKALCPATETLGRRSDLGLAQLVAAFI